MKGSILNLAFRAGVLEQNSFLRSSDCDIVFLPCHPCVSNIAHDDLRPSDQFEKVNPLETRMLLYGPFTL
jgi:hypothetical protein